MDPLRATIHQTQISLPPTPWEIAGQFVVAGLLDVGFDRDTELLLVSSSSGLGVIDCVTGQKVARDYSETLFTDRYLECQGIGPLEGKAIRMAGIEGGGLPLTATGGWKVETICLQWPNHHLLLVEPGSWLHGTRYDRPSIFHKLAIESELRAFGFSYTGLTLVIATSGSVLIYRRRRM